MFGGQSLGAIYFGGFIILSQAGESSEIKSELSGIIVATSEIKSELLGAKTPSEIKSEILAIGLSGSEIKTEIYGIFNKPKKLGYRIIIKDSAGNALGELDSFRKVKCGKRLNNYGEAEFDIRVSDPKASSFISLRKNTIEIYRENALTNTLIWEGEQALSQGVLNESGNNWATIHNFTWFERLFHRYTAGEKIFTDTDQGSIASTMITDANGIGATGITIGTVVATKNRDRTYNTQNIGEGIINLSDVEDGFDFEVTDLKAFNADSILGTDKTDDVILKYGHNIKNMTITEDFVNPVNSAIVLGEATGESTLQRVVRNDAALQATYGIREGRLQEMDVSGLSTLQDKGDAAIRKYGNPLIKVSFDLIRNITPSIDSFGIGDGIRLIAQNGIYNIDEQYRVFEWELEFDKDGAEKLSLVLGNFITI